MDTPESVHPDKEKNTEFGKIASEYTKKVVLNKKVSLEFDVQEADKYSRTLAYVYIDDIMLNELLVEQGMAKVATYPPNVKYVDKFVEAQKSAQANKLGVWADEYNI